MKPARKAIQSSLPKNLNEFRKLFDPANLIERAQTEPKAREALVIYYTPLAASIATRFAFKYPHKDVDILSEAIVAVTETVANIIKDQNDPEHAAKRIHTRVKFAIQNYLSEDATIKPPTRSDWFRQANADNELLAAAHNPEVFDYLEHDNLQTTSSFDQMWIDDILSHRVLDQIEVTVIRMKLDGYLDTEIAVRLSLSKARIGQIKTTAGNKIIKIIKGIY